MKRIIITLVVTGLFVYYLMTNFSVVQDIYNVASHITLGYLLAAILISVLAYVFVGRASRSIFHLMGMNKSLAEMIRLQLSAVAVNVLVPTGGVSIMLLYVEEAKKHQESPAVAAATYLVWALANYFALAVLLTFAIVYLLIVGNLTAFIYIPAFLFALLIIGALLLLRLSMRKPALLRKVFLWIKTIYSKFMSMFGRHVSVTQGVDEVILEIQDARGKIRSNPQSFLTAILELLGSHLLYLAAAEVLFLSFGFHPLYRVLISGYAAGALFTIVSPTPNGVGFAEVGMAAVYTTLGVNIHLAGIVAVLSRALSFWIPMLAGFVLLQKENLKNISREVVS